MSFLFNSLFTTRFILFNAERILIDVAVNKLLLACVNKIKMSLYKMREIDSEYTSWQAWAGNSIYYFIIIYLP